MRVKQGGKHDAEKAGMGEAQRGREKEKDGAGLGSVERGRRAKLRETREKAATSALKRAGNSR